MARVTGVVELGNCYTPFTVALQIKSQLNETLCLRKALLLHEIKPDLHDI
jgi:hypothetical protein